VELINLLREAGFVHLDVSTVDRVAEPPHFETVMAIADKQVLSGD